MNEELEAIQRLAKTLLDDIRSLTKLKDLAFAVEALRQVLERSISLRKKLDLKSVKSRSMEYLLNKVSDYCFAMKDGKLRIEDVPTSATDEIDREISLFGEVLTMLNEASALLEKGINTLPGSAIDKALAVGNLSKVYLLINKLKQPSIKKKSEAATVLDLRKIVKEVIFAEAESHDDVDRETIRIGEKVEDPSEAQIARDSMNRSKGGDN